MTTKTATMPHTTSDSVVGQRTNNMHDMIRTMPLTAIMLTRRPPFVGGLQSRPSAPAGETGPTRARRLGALGEASRGSEAAIARNARVQFLHPEYGISRSADVLMTYKKGI